MIELTVRSFLQQQLQLPAVLEVAASTESSFVVVEKTGSDSRNHVARADLAVQCYGATLLEAASLCERVKTAMKLLTALPQVAACRLQRDYNFTDTASKRYRYQAVFSVTYYENA